MRPSHFRHAAICAVALLSACATTNQPGQSGRDLTPGSGAVKVVPFSGTVKITGPNDGTDGGEQTKLYKGTGQLVKGQLPGGALPPPPPGAVASGPAVTLNFEGADLRDVVRNILTDILNESYTIEPTVGGTVTIRTASAIPREALPATLEMLLRSNGATMVKDAGLISSTLPAYSYSIVSSKSFASTCCPGCTSNCFTAPLTGA